ncbi:two-component response regulator [Galdieria sulphuraria]|uniref:Two-component response regulator n=1 Tax=Galdieria sulphuraria TaxID=130081 RepID=M2VTM3_GALSU|nr:two-component response regulator [Galdieria sulphuraria]EME26556.1 two-component response regulator [Galdieria sulphuraria]|eukprot:XP_005703076.1 two-component response regulator [Galdieria sulphuraria]
MRGNRDDTFSLSGFLCTPRLTTEEWPDTFVGDLSRESAKDNFRQLFSPDNTLAFDKFPIQEETFVGSQTEPQLVPEWFPFEENSPRNQTWVNVQGGFQREEPTCSRPSIARCSQQDVKEKDVRGEKDTYLTSWSFQRPTFPHYPGNKVSTETRQLDPEKDFLMREFKKKIREAAVVRFRQKRKERNFANVVRYDCRKRVADARPRFKGRFVKVKKEETSSILYDKSGSERLSSLEKMHDDDFQVVPYLV